MMLQLFRSIAASWHRGEWARREQSVASLPRNLKRLREAKGWNISTLAAQSRVNASTIRFIERGHIALPDLDLTTVLVLARALGVGIEALVEDRKP